jgi:hypothetical protein
MFWTEVRTSAGAYVTGLLVGSLLTATLVWLDLLIIPGPVPFDIATRAAVLPATIVQVVPMAAVFWLPGLILSIAIFLLFHWLRLRAWPWLTFVGAALVFDANYSIMRTKEDIWLGPFFQNDPVLGRVEHATLMGVIGGLTGFAIWATAYRRLNISRFYFPGAVLLGVIYVASLVFG